MLILFGFVARNLQLADEAVSADITLTPQTTRAVALATVFSVAGKSSTIPTRTPEPLSPTRTATPILSPSPIATALPITVTRSPSNQLLPTPTVTPLVVPVIERLSDEQFARIGISGPQPIARKAWDAGLRWSQFLDWHFKSRGEGLLPPELIYWRTLRLSETGWDNFESWDEVERVAQQFTGQVWIIGNEPDVKWQDGVSAETYANRYHEAYTIIKNADPTAQIAIAGVTAGTDLRLRYLDNVLASYAANYGEPMPIDIWTVHAYVLREERNSWGIDIPPGMTEDSGDLYEIDDHDNLDLFVQQLVNFRRWMAANGYRDRPLAVTEYGLLLPNDYGFPQEVVEQYLRDSTSLLLTISDAEIGLPSDQNRLVQTMFWYILSDKLYPTSTLWDLEAKTFTPLGETMREFIGR